MTDNPQQLSRPAAFKGSLFLLFVVLVLISYHFIYPLLGITLISATTLFISRILFWVATILLWFYSIKVDQQPLFIWNEKKYGAGFYALSMVVLFVIIIIGVVLIQHILSISGLLKKSDVVSEMTKNFRNNMPLLLFTCLTAGVTEEIIFRAFLLPRLEVAFNKPWLAILLSSLLFGLGHAGFGTIVNIAVPVFIGLIFAWHYWKYRNIKVIMVFHFCWDLLVLLLSLKAH